MAARLPDDGVSAILPDVERPIKGLIKAILFIGRDCRQDALLILVANEPCSELLDPLRVAP